MTPKFLDELLVWHVGADRWKLQRELRYQSRADGVFTVPAGIITDLASIPHIFRVFLSPAGKYARATVLHDWLYKTRSVSRETADALLLEGSEALGVGRLTRWAMHRAVRAFGREAYYRT